ncbi:MAG: CinA family protein [Pseudomonadota bacterium]
MLDPLLVRTAAELLDDLRARGLRLATVESCTGGLVAGVLTEVAGSSDVFECGFVTYSNDAKVQLIGVSRETLDRYGAVSEAVAREMAAGALAHSRADIAVAITGIAGPGGGSRDKPVGLVHMAAKRRDGKATHEAYRFGDVGRSEVRRLAVSAALTLVRTLAAR